MHILIIPSWHDIGGKKKNQKFIHNFTSYLSELKSLEMGMIYGDFRMAWLPLKFFRNENLPYHYLGMQKFSPPKRGLLWKYWLRDYLKLFHHYTKIYGAPDVIHAHSALGLLAAVEIKKKTGIPTAYTEHMGDITEKGNLRNSFRKKLKNGIEYADYISTVSEGMRKKLEEFLNRKVYCIPNMINVEAFPAKDKQPESPVFVHIGEPVHTKGIDILVRAWHMIHEEFPDAVLHLVDEIRDVEKIKPYLRQHQLLPSVHFHGVQTQEKVAEILRNSTLLISSSRVESFGMVMAEALSSGTAVVASKTDGAMEIINADCGRIVPGENPVALAKACIEIYRQRDDFQPEKLHNYIFSNFDKRNILPKWRGVYESILI